MPQHTRSYLLYLYCMIQELELQGNRRCSNRDLVTVRQSVWLAACETHMVLSYQHEVLGTSEQPHTKQARWRPVMAPAVSAASGQKTTRTKTMAAAAARRTRTLATRCCTGGGLSLTLSRRGRYSQTAQGRHSAGARYPAGRGDTTIRGSPGIGSRNAAAHWRAMACITVWLRFLSSQFLA